MRVVSSVVKLGLRAPVVLLAMAVSSCSLDKTPPVDPDTRTPTTSSDPSVVLGAPAGSPSPSASPAATPEPQSGPAAGPCALPPSFPEHPVCTAEPGHLLSSVEAAIQAVTQKQPGLFDFSDKACSDCYKVRDVSGYYAAVLAELGTRGICSFTDMEEIAAKDSNQSSEQFDILLASGHIRRGPGVYRGICSPAIF